MSDRVVAVGRARRLVTLWLRGDVELAAGELAGLDEEQLQRLSLALTDLVCSLTASMAAQLDQDVSELWRSVLVMVDRWATEATT